VPSVLGLTLGAARTRIRARRCRVGTVQRIRTNRRKIGRVVGQTPRAGVIRPVNFRVNLRVGRR
jgi:beta-lactam-binding protein with PASTA domain